MQIVIDIPEEAYKEVCGSYLSLKSKNEMRIAIKNGTPLPKGHGKLIDEKEIDTVVNGVFNSFDKHSPETFLNVIHTQCIEAVVADSAKSEE